MWGRTDGNMIAADAYHAQSWRAEDFDACCACGQDFADPDSDDYDRKQCKDDPAVCNGCADTLGDGEC